MSFWTPRLRRTTPRALSAEVMSQDWMRKPNRIADGEGFGTGVYVFQSVHTFTSPMNDSPKKYESLPGVSFCVWPAWGGYRTNPLRQRSSSHSFPVIVSVRTYPGPLFSRVSLWVEGAALCATRASQGSPGEFYYFVFSLSPILFILFYFWLWRFVPNFSFDRLGCRLRLARFLFHAF